MIFLCDKSMGVIVLKKSKKAYDLFQIIETRLHKTLFYPAGKFTIRVAPNFTIKKPTL